MIQIISQKCRKAALLGNYLGFTAVFEQTRHKKGHRAKPRNRFLYCTYGDETIDQ